MREPQAGDRRAEQPKEWQSEPELLRSVIKLNQDWRARSEYQIAAQRPVHDIGVIPIEYLHDEIVRIDGVHVDARQLDVLKRDDRVRDYHCTEPTPG